MPAVVVDLGGTSIRLGLVDKAGSISAIQRTRLQSGVLRTMPEAAWSRIVDIIGVYADEASEILSRKEPIFVSFPGPIDDAQRPLSAPTIAGDVGAPFDLRTHVATRTGRAVTLLNDVSAAAWYLSEVTDVSRFYVVTVSSGVGTKIFDREAKYGVIDWPAYAGEIGHLVVDFGSDAPLCDCGGRGHLGAIASGRGIERLAKARASQDPVEFSKSGCALQFGASVEDLTNEAHLVPAALLGDPWANQIIKEATTPLARTILGVVLSAGIEKVFVIGGIAAALGTRYTELLRTIVLSDCDYHVLQPHLGNLFCGGDPDACLKGAAAYARRSALHPPG